MHTDVKLVVESEEGEVAAQFAQAETVVDRKPLDLTKRQR